MRILSGVFEGLTTGTPIALEIANVDQRSKDYGEIAERFRPGHADLTYALKYGIRDHRGGGRSSARETAMRVAAGAIARRVHLPDGIPPGGHKRSQRPRFGQRLEVVLVETRACRKILHAGECSFLARLFDAPSHRFA